MSSPTTLDHAAQATFSVPNFTHTSFLTFARLFPPPTSFHIPPAPVLHTAQLPPASCPSGHLPVPPFIPLAGCLRLKPSCLQPRALPVTCSYHSKLLCGDADLACCGPCLCRSPSLVTRWTTRFAMLDQNDSLLDKMRLGTTTSNVNLNLFA